MWQDTIYKCILNSTTIFEHNFHTYSYCDNRFLCLFYYCIFMFKRANERLMMKYFYTLFTPCLIILCSLKLKQNKIDNDNFYDINIGTSTDICIMCI